MADKPAWQLLTEQQAFTTYATQDDAAAVQGPGAKDYVASQDVKYWFDPMAHTTEDGRVQLKIAGVSYVMYPFVFTGDLDGDGNGILGNLVIPVSQATRVNIKPDGPYPGTGATTPVPLKPLSAFQRIRQRSPFLGFQIRNTDVADKSSGSYTDLKPVLDALAEISAKLDKFISAKLGS